MTGLTQPAPDTPIVCPLCGALWDGSEVSPDRLPAPMEELIAEGTCTRAEAYAAFLELDDLADATVAGAITQAEGTSIVEGKALALRNKAKPE
jgi:hypothetical protein